MLCGNMMVFTITNIHPIQKFENIKVITLFKDDVLKKYSNILIINN